MTRATVIWVLCAILALIFTTPETGARVALDPSVSKDAPAPTLAVSKAYASVGHRIGNLSLCVNNDGSLGTKFADYEIDYFTGQAVPSCEYPVGSGAKYLWEASFWIGAVSGKDTLVSVGLSDGGDYSEFTPEFAGLNPIVKRTNIPTELCYSPLAVSEEDYIAVYTDTVEDIGYSFSEPHKPLHLEVTQRSYAWSYSYAEDFILFDYTIKNIGKDKLENVYMGVYVDADVYWGTGIATQGWRDDICGFIESIPYEEGGCWFEDTVNIAWIADNDGDPDGAVYGETSVPHVTGTRIVRTPADELEVSFNWWISHYIPSLDFGPRERPFVGKLQEDFRDFGTGGLGTPIGDANKYYQMRNREFDYDQAYTTTTPLESPLWMPPNYELAGDFADGYDTRYLLSFGPFDLDPGQKLPLSFAYVAGQDFHTDPENIRNLPYHADDYYANVGFSDLGLNAAWAARVYDNPGVDTDGDGYAGKVRLCCFDSLAFSLDNLADTAIISDYNAEDCEFIWYEGDGVPDFKGASPPPPPQFWLEPGIGKIRVRINGQKSETTRDLFSRLPDFEGYRVYLGRDERESSYSLIGSYDKENYNKHVWTGYRFEVLDVPYTLDSLRCLYGLSCDDTLFHPTMYTLDRLYYHPLYPDDSVFYFSEQDFNVYDFGVSTSIRKTFPDQPYPSSLHPDSAAPEELTDDGYFKYFEYELIIDNLLPTVPYYVNVTAFDFGSPQLDLQPLESSIGRGAKVAYASTSSRDAVSRGLGVYVYPNPYRSDGGYRELGFEGRMEADRPDDRVRAINFANLPPQCTIRIYSLDGDLIREISHDYDIGDGAASHETWNMITRNTQMITSGLYYWTVESETGEVQIGKLVVIM